MTKFELQKVFIELAKEYLKSGSAGTNPGATLEAIWKSLQIITKEWG